MIFLVGTSISSRLLALSLRNLSVSSTSSPSTSKNPFLVKEIEEHVVRLPLITRQSNGLIKNIGISCPLWRKKEIFELPLTNKIIENPAENNTKIIEEIQNVNKIVDLPTNNSNGDDDTGKQAKNGMIMIRRRKMRKHKLRKLRKKMKFEWAKVRQRREWRKEKAFQGELTAAIREAEAFSAEDYVAEKIRKATETPIPRFWKHRRLPQFIIKQKLEEKAALKEKRKFQLWEEYGKQ